MFGMTLEKVVVVLVLAALVIGPTHLPAYARRLAAVVRGIRAYTDAARAHVEREVGAPLAAEEWRALDPRRYDPRRIVRDALVAEPATAGGAAARTSAPDPTERAPAAGSRAETAPVAEPAPQGWSTGRAEAIRLAAVSPGGYRPATRTPAPHHPRITLWDEDHGDDLIAAEGDSRRAEDQGYRSPTGISAATVSAAGASGQAHAGSYAHDGL